MSTADTLASTIYQLSAKLSRSSDQLLQDRLGIGLSQYKILQSLDSGTKIQQRQIAVELGQTEASISRQIKLLTRRGLITSQPNPANRREHQARLTAEGQQITESAQRLLVVHHRNFTSRLSQRQQEMLLDFLRML